ncbi:MAG: ribosome small subunit-dependent GTPase A [Gemmatimonadetes bacterium]|nr:ribosome small subunit-dependent GTPase A [Gemmatimonadota bacterium]
MKVPDDLWGEVRESTGGVYRVYLDDGSEVEAFLRGRLKREARAGDKVVIGDRVRIGSEHQGDEIVRTIEEVAPRRTRIVRRSGPGRKPKAVAANLDRLVVVQSLRAPDPRLEVIDRFLVLAEVDEIPALLVLNKTDLEGAAEQADLLEALYRDVGYSVLRTSPVTGEGIPALAEALSTGVSALVGPSGAGKSTLLNAVEPGLELRTGIVSRVAGRGRHTTVSSRMIPLSGGGLVADTPGFGDVGLWGVGEAELERCFPDIARYGEGCRFRGCRHLEEPGCAVKEAVEEGWIAPSRLASFSALREEARADARKGRRPGE